MAEVNVNTGHGHAGEGIYTAYVFPAAVTTTTCPAGHSTCQVSSYSVKSFYPNAAGGIFDMARLASSGEVNVNRAHSHSYKLPSYTTETLITSTATCPAGHTNCLLYTGSKTFCTGSVGASTSSARQVGEINIGYDHTHSYTGYGTVEGSVVMGGNYGSVGLSTCPLSHTNCAITTTSNAVTSSATRTSGSSRIY